MQFGSVVEVDEVTEDTVEVDEVAEVAVAVVTVAVVPVAVVAVDVVVAVVVDEHVPHSSLHFWRISSPMTALPHTLASPSHCSQSG